MTEPWVSILLGSGIGIAYGAVAYVTLYLAAHRLERQFIAIFLGGMVLRMFTLMIIVGVVAYVMQPVFLPFVAALGMTLLGAVGLEIWAAMMHVQGRSPNEQPS